MIQIWWFSRCWATGKIKEPRLKDLYDEVQRKKPATGMKLRIKHVPREENKDADRLVNQALDNAPKNGKVKDKTEDTDFSDF